MIFVCQIKVLNIYTLVRKIIFVTYLPTRCQMKRLHNGKLEFVFKFRLTDFGEFLKLCHQEHHSMKLSLYLHVIFHATKHS